MKYFEYRVSGGLRSTEYLDGNGLFAGNDQVDIKSYILFMPIVFLASTVHRRISY